MMADQMMWLKLNVDTIFGLDDAWDWAKLFDHKKSVALYDIGGKPPFGQLLNNVSSNNLIQSTSLLVDATNER